MEDISTEEAVELLWSCWPIAAVLAAVAAYQLLLHLDYAADQDSGHSKFLERIQRFSSPDQLYIAAERGELLASEIPLAIQVIMEPSRRHQARIQAEQLCADMQADPRRSTSQIGLRDIAQRAHDFLTVLGYQMFISPNQFAQLVHSMHPRFPGALDSNGFRAMVAALETEAQRCLLRATSAAISRTDQSRQREHRMQIAHPGTGRARSGPMTLAERHQLQMHKEAFELFDTDGSGTISLNELKVAIKALGMDINSLEVQKMIRDIDADGDGTIDLDEFHDMMNAEGEVSREELGRLFKLFDSDKSTELTLENLRTISHQLDEKGQDGTMITDHELLALLEDHGRPSSSGRPVMDEDAFVAACRPTGAVTQDPTKCWWEVLPAKWRRLEWAERIQKMKLLKEKHEDSVRQYQEWRRNEDQKLREHREEQAVEWEAADRARATGYRPGAAVQKWEQQRLGQLGHRVSHASQGW